MSKTFKVRWSADDGFYEHDHNHEEEIVAFYMCDAAESFAEIQFDAWGWESPNDFAGGRPLRIEVQRDDGSWWRFNVTGEAQIRYDARNRDEEITND